MQRTFAQDEVLDIMDQVARSVIAMLACVIGRAALLDSFSNGLRLRSSLACVVRQAPRVKTQRGGRRRLGGRLEALSGLPGL